VRRSIKVLAVGALVAVMLAMSVSPALAAKVRGGVLPQTTAPCDHTSRDAEDVTGSRLVIFPPGNPEGREPGCWVLLYPERQSG
jgi:hypothetical protein